MNKFICILLFLTVSFAEILEDSKKSSVDCLILEDENSIICKYEHERMEEDKEIKIQWVNPLGKISRDRIIIIPAGHGSIYDFRYIDGREKGLWKFKAIYEDEILLTEFELK
jgi:hypothetical protein